ncbi:MAG TPA: putative peptidoglycan glycosyltransferase FtsW [Anaerolineales bacterium]|nr:putative peptidoglycan glycosyltransferase FtsW [Anaerolineales bacterium]
MFRTVGERPAVNSARRIGKSSENWLQRFWGWLSGRPSAAAQARMVSGHKTTWLKFDVPLLIIVVSLLVFGLVILASASYDISYRINQDPSFIFLRQLTWLAIGLAAFLISFLIDYHRLEFFALPMMILTLVLLSAVLVINMMSGDVMRALYANSGQPSELAKFVVVIYLAVWLQSKGEQLKSFSFGFLPMAIIIGLVAGLIFIQPDFSAVATVLTLGGILFFIAGGNITHIGLFLGVTVVVGYMVVSITGRGMDRIIGFWEGIKSPINGPDQIVNSLSAFVEGGWFGVGVGNSETKLIYLQVPHTDSIFAVVGAETGVIGSVVMVLLFSLLLWQGIRIARRAPDPLGVLLAGGMTIWLAIEAFLNMAVMVSLLPVTGNALPFVSFGGSNLVTSMAAIGVIMSVARSSILMKEEKGTFFDAVVSLRGRDRGRRVSSPRRTASHR